MTSELLAMQLAGMQSILRHANTRKPGAGRPRKGPVIGDSEHRPARVADEPRMAIAFYVRRMNGEGWELAAGATAQEFRVAGERAASRVERAAKNWKGVVVPLLIELFPTKAERLRGFLRERKRQG